MEKLRDVAGLYLNPPENALRDSGLSEKHGGIRMPRTSPGRRKL